MKSIFIALLSVLSFSAHASNTVVIDEPTSKKIVDFFESGKQTLNSGIPGGMYQGEYTYGAQVECSNKLGDEKTETMTCYVRAVAGFSKDAATKSAPIVVPNALAAVLKKTMNDANLGYLIGHGFQALGGVIRCVRDSETKKSNCSVESI